MESCPVCLTSAQIGAGLTRYDVDCPRCGKFSLSRAARDDLPEKLREGQHRAAIMSHNIRRRQREDGNHPQISPEQMESYWSRGRLPMAQEQADDLILWIGDNQRDNATSAKSSELALDAWIGSALPQVSNSANAAGLRWLVSALETNPRSPKFFVCNYLSGVATFQMTLAGWKEYAALKKVRKESRTAFMAMRFNKPELQNVVESCFRKAVKRADFDLRVLTDPQVAGLIDDNMRSALLAARFVIADLTHGSRGAYWEAGFGEGLGLPVIYTCKESVWRRQQTHFDTNHLVTIIWNPAELKKAEDQLTATIRATLRTEAKQTDND
jgi:hypothetical protein